MSLRRRKELDRIVTFMENATPDGTALSGFHEWFIARVWTMKEVETGARLMMMGAGVYCPIQSRRKKIGRGLKLRHVPTNCAVFTSYIFVAPGSLSWLSLFESGLVLSVICEGDRPVSISRRQLAAIASRERHGAFKEISSNSDTGIAPGDLVRVDEGPLRGLRFTAQKVRDGLVSVLWDAVGKKNFVELRVDSVSKAA